MTSRLLIKKTSSEKLKKLRFQMVEEGLNYSGELIVDGAIHRGFLEGDSKAKKSFWYVLFDCHGLICGSAGNWKQGIKIKLCSKDIKNLAKKDRVLFYEKQKEAQRQYSRELAARQQQAQRRAKEFQRNGAVASENHGYLTKKKIKSMGLLQAQDGRLMIPVCDDHGELWNLQFINDDGEKKFLFGGKKKGCFFEFGDSNAGMIHLSEGYATAFSVYESMGGLAIVAFDCYNMVEVAKIIREKHPKAEILIIGDEDSFGQENNGRKYATTAAEAIGAKLFFPDFSLMDREIFASEQPTDANDLRNLLGVQELKSQLSRCQTLVKKRDVLPEKFILNDRGLFYSEDEGDEKFVSSKLAITALLRDGRSNNWGRLLEFTEAEKTPHLWGMPMEMLKGSGDELRGELLNRGVSLGYCGKAKSRLMEYISASKPEARASCVTKIGWYKSVFVLPDKTIGKLDERVIYQAAHQVKDFSQKGTLNEWRDKVSLLCRGNSRLVLAVSAAFAAMLLHPTDTESGGIHFVGASSTGKTTALRVAASVYGAPNYLHRWRATSNALEATALLRNDCLFILDEISQVSASEAGEIIYMLANGSGKGRANRYGEARERSEWQTLVMSSGEVGLAQHINEGAKRAKAGQQVRLVDISADAEKNMGMFEDLHGVSTASAFSNMLTEAASNYHGTAFLTFLEILTEYGVLANSLEKINSWRKQFSEQFLPFGASGQVTRVCDRFSLIAAAGELATHFGITAWGEGESISAAGICFNAWFSDRGGNDNQETFEILSQVKHFFELHGSSRFHEEGVHIVVYNRAGFREKERDGTYRYYVMTEAFSNELCAGYSHNTVIKVLREADWIECDSEGKSSKSVKRSGMENKMRCYVFNNRMWEE